MEIEEKIVLPAPPERVWRVLVDLDAYREWNPFIVWAEGEVVIGQRFSAKFQPPGSRGSRLRPRFTAVEPGRKLAWLGHVGVPGIFDGAHEFVLERQADGTTLLTQRESFTGLLAPIFRSTIERSREGFRNLNNALADRVLAAHG